jgi:TonB-linked SusC/RagA family outer membrane protein
MKSKFTWIFTLIMAFFIQFAFAQQKTVTGVVSDTQGMPIPGVSVAVQGQAGGVQTDLDGRYSIQASTGQKIVFTFVGMATESATVGASNTVSVQLKDDARLLDEVVVVGYGTTTKEAFVGTATSIKMQNIADKAVSNVSQALKGEVAGVNVITTSGQPGTSATIRIRGFGSVNGNRDPLYVVDNVPYLGNISSINPTDIESMTVLKDATATAIYGSRGANGVIVIKTKGGRRSKSAIEVDFKTGYNMSLLPRYSTISSPEEYIGLAWEGKYNRGITQGAVNAATFANNTLFGAGGIDPAYNLWNVNSVSELIDPVTRQVRPGVTRKYNPEDWEDFGFQTSYRQEANVKFSGGDEKASYYTSVGYLDDQGYIINSDFKRYSVRTNLDFNPAEWLNVGTNLSFVGARSNNNGQTADSGSIFWFADNIPSIYPLFLRDADGNYVADPYFGGNQFDYGGGVYPGSNGATGPARGFGGLTNAIADATYDRDQSTRYELNGTMFANIKFHKNLVLETRYGLQYYDNERNNRNNPFYGSSNSTTFFGSLTKTQTRFLSQNFLQLLRFNKQFDKHNLEVLAAHESNQFKTSYFTASNNFAALTNTFDLSQYVVSSGIPTSYTEGANIESFFGQASYNFDSKYYFIGTARTDGSSRFKKDKWGTFGSVGASWIVSRESFMENTGFIDFLKVKTSYGLTGDQAGVGFYPGDNTFGVGQLNGDYSFPIDANGNENLTWETSKIFQVGLETTFFNDFLDVNVDYYIKNTDDLIFQRRVGPSAGIAITTVNDGQLRNKGLEFDILAHIIKPKSEGGFRLDFGINGEILDNEITTMPLDPGTGRERNIDTSNSPYGWAKGKSIYDFYMPEYAGVDSANGNALYYMYFDDVNSDGVFNTGDVIINSLTEYQNTNPGTNVGKTTTAVYANATNKFIGKSAIPDVRGAFRLNAAYKGFDLSAQFTYSLGGYGYDYTYAGLMGNGVAGSNNYHTDIRSRWQNPGDVTNVPRVSDDISYQTSAGNVVEGNTGALSTRYITKSDYLGLNNIRLGYTVPSRFVEQMQLSNLSVYVTGDNLLFFSKRDGFNPSTSESGSSNTYRYSPLSTFTLGVNVQF